MAGKKVHGKVIWPGFSEVETRHVAKVGRNDPCPCGSEKKYKDCHEREGSRYLIKLARQAEKERAREIRAKMKAAGVPWWRRMLVR